MGQIYDSTNKIYIDGKFVEIENVNEPMPQKLYKYFAFPKKEREAQKHIKQLKKGDLWLSSRVLLNDPLDLILLKTDALTKDERDYFLASVANKIYLCLTDRFDKTLMWAHYADSFRGYCVEFKYNESSEKQCTVHRIKYVDGLLDMQKEYKQLLDIKNNGVLAQYFAMSLPKKMIWEIKHLEIRQALRALGKNLFFTKTKDWEYENEYRFLFTTTLNGKKGEFRNVQDMGLEILSVTFGINTSIENIKKFKEAFNSTQIAFYQLAYSEDQLNRKLI